MTNAEKYLLAAYLVVLAAVLAYVLIFAGKLARLERELGELAELARAKRTPREQVAQREEAPVG